MKLGEGHQGYFESLVENGTSNTPITTKSHQNLKDAVKEFQDWLKEQDDIDAVVQCVCKELGFLFYIPEMKEEIGIMFEVINNRGKHLSELEKIKNDLFYFSAKNHKEDIKEQVEKKKWPKILEYLNEIGYVSNEQEGRFLRNCRIVFWDTHKSRSHHVYDNLKQGCPPDKSLLMIKQTK